jgi:hypothetical protein
VNVEGASGQLGGAWTRMQRRGAEFASYFTVARIGLLLIVIGVALRLWHLLSGRSLWLDEAMIAASLSNRDWAGLLQPLEYSQVAPLGWLFLEKGVLELLGGSDLALRLPQFVAGVAVVLLAAHTARRLFAAPGFVIAVGAFALSVHLVRFSAEAKPYQLDALASVLAVAFAARLFGERAGLGVRDLIALLIGGAAAVALSFPAAFVLAGLGSALFLREVLARRWVPAAGIAVVSALWLALFVALQSAMHQGAGQNLDVMQADWQRDFAPFPPTSVDDLKWYVTALFGLFSFNFGPGAAIAGFLATGVGAIALVRRNVLWGIVLLAPIAFALMAASLQLYPFKHRLLLFAAPLLYFLAAAGVDAAASTIRARGVATAVAAILLLHGFASAIWGAFTYFPTPFGTEHVRPVLERIAAMRQESDPIFVDGSARPAYRHYSGQVGLADAPVLSGRGEEVLGCVLDNLETISAHPRVWVLYTHAEPVMGTFQDVVLRELADTVGTRVETIESISVKAWLYEFDDDSRTRMAALRVAMRTAECPA